MPDELKHAVALSPIVRHIRSIAACFCGVFDKLRSLEIPSAFIQASTTPWLYPYVVAAAGSTSLANTATFGT
jgi:hypothetical protein